MYVMLTFFACIFTPLSFMTFFGLEAEFQLSLGVHELKFHAYFWHHGTLNSVSFFFVPKNEKNTYVTTTFYSLFLSSLTHRSGWFMLKYMFHLFQPLL